MKRSEPQTPPFVYVADPRWPERCDQCDAKVPAVVHVGEVAYYESRDCSLCLACLDASRAMLSEALKNLCPATAPPTEDK